MSDVLVAEPDDGEVIEQPEANLPALADPGRIVAVTPAAFMPAPWEDLKLAAQIVASAPGLHPRFRDPDAAMFIAYQAARFGSDPYALASKVYFTESTVKSEKIERVGYEAQWVMAIIDADPLLVEPLDYQYGYSNPAAPLALNRFVRVTGKLLARSGRVVTRSVTTPTVAQIVVKNSPLWFSDPDQQLAYYGGRLWGRRHRPARILGLYTREEIEALEMPTGRPALFEEEDAPVFDTIAPTEQQQKAGERWEAKAKGGDSRDPRDAPANRGADAGSGPAPAASEPEPPPDNTGNQPAELADIRAWAEAERARLVTLTDPAAIDEGGAAMQADKRWRKLTAYDQADARRIVRSLKNRIDELEAG